VALLIVAGAFAAYRYWGGSRAPSGPAKITQISHWDKPMERAKLSPDGHTVAFVSPVAGVSQVFVMLTSGGEPLQLTKDEGEKVVDSFSTDGTEIYYGRQQGIDEGWAVPTLGGTPRRVVAGFSLVPSTDGGSIFYLKGESQGIFRADRTRLGEEQVYSLNASAPPLRGILPFPDGNRLLVLCADALSLIPRSQVYEVDLSKRTAMDLGKVPSYASDVAWGEAGKTVLLNRTVSGLTNIWKYSLNDKALTQITFGTGPDASPMPDPGGKGLYFVNGKSSGLLTVYNVHSKQSTDIASENATQPAISPDGKRVMYIAMPAKDRNELWVSNIDGSNKVKLASGDSLATTSWAPDNFHLAFVDEETGATDKPYVTGADGSGLRQLPWSGGAVFTVLWSADQKIVYLTGIDKRSSVQTVWKENADGSGAEKIASDCGNTSDVSPSGQN
jgi:Tol biopolymer transport system component